MILKYLMRFAAGSVPHRSGVSNSLAAREKGKRFHRMTYRVVSHPPMTTGLAAAGASP